MITILSKAGYEYKESIYDGSWRKHRPTIDNSSIFIGAEHNLPTGILRQLSKIRPLKPYTRDIIRLNPQIYKHFD